LEREPEKPTTYPITPIVATSLRWPICARQRKTYKVILQNRLFLTSAFRSNLGGGGNQAASGGETGAVPSVSLKRPLQPAVHLPATGRIIVSQREVKAFDSQHLTFDKPRGFLG
jgi:hypothetical protein